jgi:integrase-like protein
MAGWPARHQSRLSAETHRQRLRTVRQFFDDRDVPLHPELVRLLAAWTADKLEYIRRCKRLITDHRGPLDWHVIGRIVRRVGRAAGVPGVHPHRLRHTLATQAINRGMRLEAIAALLGHRKMEMTLIYARIANRVVADEYAAVTAKIDALYGQPPALPADYENQRHGPAAPRSPRPPTALNPSAPTCTASSSSSGSSDGEELFGEPAP